SGTAAAHLHAAVLEADMSGVPLLALTADRPPELRATGANQTIDQAGLYGGAVRWAADVGVPEEGREEAQNRYWRSLVAKALLVASGALSGDPGPVHLNLALREPLLPGDEPAEPAGPWAGRPGGLPWTTAGPRPAAPPEPPGPSRTLLVVGDAPPGLGRAAAALADACHWPVVAEPSSGAWASAGALRGGALMLGVPGWLAAHRPQRVLVVGRPTLSRPVNALLADPAVRVETVAVSPRWADAVRAATRVSMALSGAGGPLAEMWRATWLEAAGRVGAAVDRLLDARPGLPAARLARDVVAALPAGSLLVLGSSTPVRDVDRLAVPRGDVALLANRGVAGIDGTVSTALGAALAHQRAGGG
ncbi:MAG: 2-succinyl-5-enolpyruvyl-6-hydroxy-3-cyclohexene-1-carboxylic-acid synthase, partial [Geodermatophilales bacterium]|nr:2-succinyl-5-enolpyruvyl-6-hydroxy-3-cyclohexene-1-carboxylic-acid synthase [Geodermatophilales bacterium]